MNYLIPMEAESVVAAIQRAAISISAKAVTAALPTSGWSSNTQTVAVTGVTAVNVLLVASDPACLEDWNKAGVYAYSQTSNSITFKCTKTPMVDLTANILIVEGTTEQ